MVLINIGNGYNPRNGIFTCPQDGVYVFTWTVMDGSRQQGCRANIYKNGVRSLEAYSWEGSQGYAEDATNTVVYQLSVGDTVFIKTITCDQFDGYPYTGFSGWKI